MKHENFVHADPDAFHGRELSLHDCVANRISLEKEGIRFFLPEGFWVVACHGENPWGKTARTDASEVMFSCPDTEEISLRVFCRGWGLLSRRTFVEERSAEWLVREVNSGKCTLEFISQYKSFYEQMWHCALHSERKPYYRECQLYLPRAKADFFWNGIRPDCCR